MDANFDTGNYESSMLERLAEGDTAQQMAEALGLSLRTINFRLMVLYSKYDLPPGKNRHIKLLRATGWIRKPE